MLPIDPATARILEIGTSNLMLRAFPERTQLLWTGRKWRAAGNGVAPFSLRSALQARRDLRAGKYDLVVVWVDPYAPWDFHQLRALFDRPYRPLASLIRIFGVQALRFFPKSVPVIAVDMEDSRTISRHSHFLFERVRYFFKRELPVDRWQVFQHSAHPGMPGSRFRRQPKFRRRINLLRPITLGCSPAGPIAADAPFPEKTSDVFAAVTLEGGTTVRNEGLKQLRALADAGLRIDLPTERLSPKEFQRRMAAAWLTWSPEGLGWQCFRHYEAPLAFSIPLINEPTIARYRPLIDGVHAFYYQPDDPESLGRVIRAALADQERLRAMAAAARSLVLANHVLPQPLADALLRMGLGLEEAPGGVELEIGSQVDRAIDGVAEQRKKFKKSSA